MTDKAAKGLTAYYAGLAAEDQVAKHYERLGAEVLDTRWRGEGGEIDLILRLAGIAIFVEVKKSRDMTSAADMLSATQVTRIMVAAGEYMAVKGLLGDMRVDAALVDQQGAVEVIENITLDF